jgi:hypothetical protein
VRWDERYAAELCQSARDGLRLVFRVEVEVCPRCGGEVRIVAFVAEPDVVRRILVHLDRRGVDARAGPWAAAAGAPG